jgi:hypothetical protein
MKIRGSSWIMVFKLATEFTENTEKREFYRDEGDKRILR